jgi:hypothetical protein
MKRWVILLGVAACTSSSSEDVPSCQQAVAHYYGAGCALFMTNGQPYSELETVANCKELLATAPNVSCEHALEDLRVCFGTVRSPATSNADCDCSVEQDALLTCE